MTTMTKLPALFFSYIAALLLAGCAMQDMMGDPATSRGLLQPWTNLTDAQVGETQLGWPGTGRIALRRPVGLSARDGEIYLIDAGLNRIFRYSPTQQTLTPFTSLSASAGMSIYAAPDRSVYITDPNRAEVLHFTHDGTPLPSFVSPGNLMRPVAVTVNENNGQLVVADGLLDQFITFSSFGMTLSVVKPRPALAIAAMAGGPDGLYVADRLERKVIVLGWDGAVRYTLADKDLVAPSAIVVSRDNVVFVGDSFDQTVKVYRGRVTEGSGQKTADKVAKVGGVGAASGRFNGIAGLAVDGGHLYVADSLNARVQIMLMNQSEVSPE